ncbi:diaminopimelate decarboxylase [Caproiciproducens sp. R2]|uniref:diaminopimelate decarboxylase n=1 Tax=Caproiciproducens sp. R2 TaxID=3435187 RepID=UPI004034BFAD
MLNEESLNTNTLGHLTIGGCDTVELAQEYGTPLYMMDEDSIRRNCRMYRSSFDRYYNGHGMPLYASKAFSCKEICRIVNEEKLGLDVVSGGELYTALSAGFPAERIHFHGNNKTTDEIAFALRSGVGHIVVDNLTELHTLNEMALAMGKTADITIRVKPGIDAHTHEFIRTGQIDSKFGFALETGEAMEAVKAAIRCKNINLTGLHCHIGSQIFDIQPFVLAAEVMLSFIDRIKRETGIIVRELNLGGGFGIQYTDSDTPVAYDQYMKTVSEEVRSCCKALGFDIPFLYLEPGRSIVGEAGITLYTIGAVKKIPDVRTYVSVDGGMTDNPRYALYRAGYTALVANKASLAAAEEVTIAGKCCESGDLIQENTMIQPAQPGDTLAVLSTGAYNYSMASNYNRIPRPAVVMVHNGMARVIVKRETYEDLIRNDI